VSRHGGDEFVILLAEVGVASDAVVIADKRSAWPT
jgi:GGDEF domain-containing protein